MEHINKNEKHKRAFIIWLAIYPLITFLYYLIGDYLLPLPVALRTFILTAIAVPVMYYILVPLFNKLFRKWLQKA
jgi:antibiotic biosynthesis monooxygenase (ABM) superfamily enzyme